MIEPITHEVIGAAMEVHRNLGPGLLESAYEACLCHELVMRDISFINQAALPLVYKDLKLEQGYRIDILVPGQLIVEIKAVDGIAPVHEAQLLTYLKLTGIRVGLILNFYVPVLKDGIRRMVLGLYPSSCFLRVSFVPSCLCG
jgi:GxxExxY protein